MAITTGNFQNFLDGLARKIESELANRAKTAVYPKFIAVKSTSKKEEVNQNIENMNAAQYWAEGSPRPELDFKEGWTQRFSQHQWGALMDITKAMRKFAQKELIVRMSKQMRDATYKAKELIAAYYLEYGATAIASVPKVGGLPVINSIGGDGQTLFYATHTFRSGGGTWGNLSASSDDLTEDTLSSHRTVIRRWKDNTGAPLDIMPVALIIPPDLEKKAYKVLRSDKEPGTANNALNYAKTLNLEVIVNQWLSDTADWYIKTGAQDGDIEFYFAWDDEVESGTNPRTGNECRSIDFSLGHGCNICRSLYKVA